MKIKRPLLLICLAVTFLGGRSTIAQRFSKPGAGAQSKSDAVLTHILGRPTDQSIAVSVLASRNIELSVEYGISPENYPMQTEPKKCETKQPVEIEINGLKPDTRYYYRLRSHQPETFDYLDGSKYSFHTQRLPGSTFMFALQGSAGTWEFDEKRPKWELPIHQLMVKNGVTIFFQGHDHLFAHQQRDGLIYQSTPNPADASYQAFNREAYRSGDILPNSGYLRVAVSPLSVRVDYIRSYLPKDETSEYKNGELAFSYTVKPTAYLLQDGRS